ncbi:MAG: ribonuclease III [SAR202 cluster bacterium]|nr:ribonuclease III [SAR202 cluster bacterium]
MPTVESLSAIPPGRTVVAKKHPLEQALGVKFKDKELLNVALTHGSYLNENPGADAEDNERLEFLGDAVLGMVIGDEFFNRYPAWTEGHLTQARSLLVRDDTLAIVADRLEMGRHLTMGKGEEAGGGRSRASNRAGAFEALVGALFLDQGFETAQKLVLKVMGHELSTIGSRLAVKNPKSVLQEAMQKGGKSTPTYSIVSVTGKDPNREWTAEVYVDGKVMGRGKGPKKAIAEQAAATEALKSLEQ